MSKKELLRFLKEERVFTAVIKYLKNNSKFYNMFSNYKGDSSIEFINYCLKYNNPDYVLLKGFQWSKTKEGYEFWDSIFNKLLKYEQRTKRASS